MFGPVRAVVVDDTPSHLFCIGTGFAAAGIPCTPYWYDKSEVSLNDKLKPKPPTDGNEYLRIIFTDLNLEEEPTGGLAVKINPVISVIEQLVSSDGGPYAVIFWTIMTEEIEDIRIELMERLNASGIHLPIAIDEIKKSSFLETPSKELKGEEVLQKLYAETFSKTNDLKEEVLDVLRKYGLLLMISEWESRAMRAAGKSSNSLFSAAKLGAMGSEEITDVLKKVSALVSQEAVGKSAKEMPARAYDAAMQSILVDSFSQSVNEEKYSDLVRDVLQSVIDSKISIENQEGVYAKLNAIFHIDTDVKGVLAIDRGAVIDFKSAVENGIMQNVDGYCQFDDYFWRPHRDNVSVDLLPIENSHVSSICVKLADSGKELVKLFKKAVLSVRQDRNSEINRVYNELKESGENFNKSLRWVLIEIGADCDHAQGKSRSLRYLTAAVVPAKYVRDYVYGGSQNKLKNEALEILGPYDINGDIFYMLISLKRFLAWQPPEALPDIDILYRFRESIVDYLLNHYATWSMRPGITEYKLQGLEKHT